MCTPKGITGQIAEDSVGDAGTAQRLHLSGISGLKEFIHEKVQIVCLEDTGTIIWHVRQDIGFPTLVHHT